MPRPRDRILGNLETIYREAYDRAKASGDEAAEHTSLRHERQGSSDERWREGAEPPN